MGKASISINIGALWSGSSTIDKVNSDLSRMAKNVSQLSTSTTQALALQGQDWVDLGNSIYNTGAKISAVGESLTKSITEPMTTVGTYCVNQAFTFDTALANLNKTANLTTAELEDFGEAAIEASKTSPVTSDDILNAEALGAQLGISSDKLQEFATVATGLDIATNMGLEEASTEMARFLNIMNESDDAVSNYGSTIVNLGNNYATTESEIANMAERLAGASANTKLTSQDVLGLAAAMSSLGIKAEAGGSSMTTIFNNMSAAVDEGGEQLQAYADIAGTTAEEFANKWKSSPIEAFELMIEKAHELNENGGSLTETLDSWGISGIRQTDVMQRLINNGTILTEAVNDANTAWEENTALTVEVDKRNQSLESRFKTLQNNANAAATTVGTVLGDQLLTLAEKCLLPVLNTVNDVATAFKNMSTPAQQAVTTLGLLVAAAGPLVTMFGKFVQSIGNTATKFGEFQQKAAVLGDSLKTTDGAALRVYASTKDVATAVGVAGNSAVKAAGGVDNYVKSWEQMVDSAKVVANAEKNLAENIARVDEIQLELVENTSLTKKEQNKLAKEAENLSAKQEDLAGKILNGNIAYKEAATQITKFTGNTKEAEKAIELTGLESANLDSALQSVASNMTTTGKSASTMASLFSGLKTTVGGAISGFLKANAVSIAITGLSVAIGVVAEKVMEWKNKQDLLNDVNQTAGSIMDSAREKASYLGDAIGDVQVDVDGTLTKIQELNGTLKESMTSYEVNSAKVDQYVSVMQELGNKSSLTATEQWKLQQAVEGYNEVTGSAYQLTEDYKVAVEGENGLVQVSSDMLAENAQAWRAKAEAEAYAAKAAEYMEAEVEAQMQLKQAQEQLSSAQERYNELKAKGTERTVAENMEMNKLASTTIPELETNVNDLTTAYDSAASSTDYLTSMSEMAASSLSDGLKTVLMELPSTASTSAADMCNNFQAAIQAGTITEEGASAFTAALQNYLSALPTEAQADGAATAANLSAEIANGTVSVTTATSQLQQLATNELNKLKDNASTAGSTAGNNYASAIGSTSGAASNSGKAVASSAESGVSTSVSKLQSIGLKAGDGYDTSLSRTSGGAYSAGEAVSAQASAGVNSRTGEASGWGSDMGANFASGLSSMWDRIVGAAKGLADAAASVLHFSEPEKGIWSGAEHGGITSGKHLGQNFATGMLSAIPDVQSAANTLASAANFGGAFAGAGAFSSSFGGGAQALNPVVNNYSLSINGIEMGGSSSKVQELIQAVFNEYSLTLDMN